MSLTPLPNQGCPVVMGSMCAGSVRCYAAMLRAQLVTFDSAQTRLPLRHSHHRYTIEGPNGVQTLTVPLEGGTNAMHVPMSQVRISEHGRWRQLHWGALFSAYGKSPYFDYIADDLHRIIMGRQQLLLDFNTQLHNLVVDFLDLPLLTRTMAVEGGDVPAGHADLRCALGGKRPDGLDIANVPYYQLWAARQGGFAENLSILDMLMNVGRESVLYLSRMSKTGPTELKDVNTLHFVP